MISTMINMIRMIRMIKGGRMKKRQENSHSVEIIETKSHICIQFWDDAAVTVFFTILDVIHANGHSAD